MQEIPGTKRCTRCGKEFPLSEGFYKRSRLTKDGNPRYDSLCRACRKKHNHNVRSRKKKVGVFRQQDGRLYIYDGKHGGNRIFWSADMLTVLRRYYPNTPDTEVSEMLGVSTKSVSRKAKQLNLKKSNSYVFAYRSRQGKLNIRKAIQWNREHKRKLTTT